jgi:hypothetical protein
MNRVEVSRRAVGILYMQVCAEKDATDEEILLVCNGENPSGTSLGWCEVVRVLSEGIIENMLPIVCDKYEGRLHFLVSC